MRHDAMLRGDGIAAWRGHPVLGAPLGDDAFVEDFVEDFGEARRLSAILDSLLLADPDARTTDLAGVAVYMRPTSVTSSSPTASTLQSRLRHFSRLLAPGRVDHVLERHDQVLTGMNTVV